MLSYRRMQGLRRHFVWIIGAWLLCQSSMLIIVPVSLCGNGPAIEQACTCSHADGTECPMHHTKKPTRTTPAGAASAPAPCSCRSTSDPSTATLASLFSPVAVLTPTLIVGLRPMPSTPLSISDVRLVDPATFPDPHPPRI